MQLNFRHGCIQGLSQCPHDAVTLCLHLLGLLFFADFIHGHASYSSRLPQFLVFTILERETVPGAEGDTYQPTFSHEPLLASIGWPGGQAILETTHPFRAGVGSVPHKSHHPHRGEKQFSKGKLACHHRKVNIRDSQPPCSWPLALSHSFPGPPSLPLVPVLQALHLLTYAEKPYLPDHSMTASDISDLRCNATLSERPSQTLLKCHSVIPSDFTLFICWI